MHENAIKMYGGSNFWNLGPKNWRFFRDFGQNKWRIWRYCRLKLAISERKVLATLKGSQDYWEK